MDRRSVLIGLGAGFVIALVLVASAMGAVMAVDKLTGPTITDVSLMRINDTHAAVAWTSEKPTNSAIQVVARRESSHGTWDSVYEDSERTRTHLIVAPIYDWNRTKVDRQVAPPGNGSIEEYKLRVSATDDGSDPYYAPILECTSESSQNNRSDLSCETVT